MKERVFRKIMGILIMMIPGALFAEETVGVSAINSGDTAWVLISAALVLMMTVPALAMFYAGMVRRKNVLSTLYYSLGSAIVVSLLWVLFQYSITFGGKELIPGVIGGFDKSFLENIGITSIYSTMPTVPEFAFSAFQFTFAAITVALISGAVVERMNFKAWMIFSVLWSTFVYSPIAHMVWNPNGILAKMGVLDYAGGYVVEIASGVSAITAALFIGERVRFKKEAMLPSNIPMVFIGAGLLWFGWFGFNAGSAGAANGMAANAFLTTNTAGAAAALAWLLLEWKRGGKPSLIGAVSGLVAGLVAITPAAGFVDAKASLVIGFVAGALCYFMVVEVKKKLGYDDSLDVFGIHGMAGTWGIIANGLFANPKINPLGTGLFYGNSKQIITQVIGIVVVYGVSIIGTLAILNVMKFFVSLRVEPQEEIYGLDLVLHGERVSE